MTDIASGKSECGIRKWEVGMRNSEVGSRNAECGIRKWEYGMGYSKRLESLEAGKLGSLEDKKSRKKLIARSS